MEVRNLQDISAYTNTLPIWGNDKSMNLNHLILTNIQNSNYFKLNLCELKTFHEIVDEIYYKVGHLEPWEKGSRKTAGQTGMCGGVRGVGAGGIVSTAFCILFKLFTTRISRKQLSILINHRDSPFIRGIGFLYIRLCQPPSDLWDWLRDYLQDEEEIDVKAGGGELLNIGKVCMHMLSRLDWYAMLFPRIPVPIEMKIQKCIKEWKASLQEISTNKSSPTNDRYQNPNKCELQDNQSHSNSSFPRQSVDFHSYSQFRSVYDGDGGRRDYKNYYPAEKRHRSRSRSHNRHPHKRSRKKEHKKKKKSKAHKRERKSRKEEERSRHSSF